MSINDLLCLELGRLAAGRRGGCAQDLASPPIIQYQQYLEHTKERGNRGAPSASVGPSERASKGFKTEGCDVPHQTWSSRSGACLRGAPEGGKCVAAASSGVTRSPSSGRGKCVAAASVGVTMGSTRGEALM